MAIATPALYVACLGPYGSEESYVIALDPSDLSVRDHVTFTANHAARLAMRPDGYQLWVSHFDSNIISVLNANTLELVDTIAFGEEESGPYEMAIRMVNTWTSPMSFPQVLLACANVSKIYVYNMFTRHKLYELTVETRRIDGSANVYYVKLDHSARRLYAYSLLPQKDSVYVFELGDRYNLGHATQTNEICLRADCTELEPTELSVNLQEAAIHPDGTKMYIANFYTSNRIEVVDLTENVYLDPITIDDYFGARALAISPNGVYLYVSFLGQRIGTSTSDVAYVVMFNLETERVVHVEEMPNNPRTMALTPSGDRLFVTDHEAHEICAFDISIERETMSLSHRVNLDTVVSSGYASPVEVLYLERRYLVPYPYAQVSSSVYSTLNRLWQFFLRFKWYEKIMWKIQRKQ
jgi:6-phosphogluconolactonase (cycloisomerase 2 family)